MNHVKVIQNQDKIIQVGSGKSRLQLFKPKISVVGVGGGGGNAVNHMIRRHLEGVEFVVCNTDQQDLVKSLSSNRIQLGPQLTRGHGAGSKPEIGRMAAEESIQDVMEQLKHSDLVFLAAGMGGGTGTGSSPIIAREIKKMNNDVLVAAVVTRPFRFEGKIKQNYASEGLEELGKYVDTLVVVSNDRLLSMAQPNTTIVDSFSMADEILHSGVKTITSIINHPGLINLDFSDIKAILTKRPGYSRIGVGEASGEDRALKAAFDALNNPLVESDGQSSKAILINIASGDDISLKEIGRAITYLQENAHPEAEIKVGHYIDNSLAGRIRISVLYVH
ncbi:hypothetical protein SAMD00019534_014120 [Acytostelium subglobosum LB1]|uniref:hypothetical protein n=1 Tax=Acytostelium subglobosum LB1 TaxID=1410327 RepID=UPI000644A92F|nr:hypothetical protein SAMD00019534_014120 [Acytostelium subglobosum LB1]GAM18238.1 hypothetical protein SAMD00019534_014120 [Acytostelium subglobosum LB1]|eukprot:XP_012758834.1 hypothetical protein SAMD00019534_014120 [Acytostelium subglobosum LB1]